jgi:hypothetical protein
MKLMVCPKFGKKTHRLGTVPTIFTTSGKRKKVVILSEW